MYAKTKRMTNDLFKARKLMMLSREIKSEIFYNYRIKTM